MRVWTTTLFLLLAACGDAASNDTADTDVSDTATTDSTTLERSARLSGAVTSASGPVGGANIRLCHTVCKYATTDAQGAYAFKDVPVAWQSFEIVPPPGSGLATAFAPIELGSNEDRTIDMVLPPLDPAHPLGATAELELGSGLLVTVGADDIAPPLFVDAASEAAGVQLTQDIWPPVDRPGTIVALWYTVPFDHHAVDAGGLPVRIENQWGLPEGATYEVWVGSYSDFAWIDAGTLTVGSDGWLTGDAALPLLSTIALVAPE